MDKLQMAKALLSETKYSNPGQTTTAYGVAVTDSQDGLVSVDMGGDTVSFDDEQAIECETTFKVYEGDEVIVSLIGADGSGKTPIIIGVVGRGDEQQTEIDGVKNYFWTNDRGAHISTVEQSVEGANMLLDADSLDIRIGGSNSEEDQTTVAKFGRDTAYISGIDGTRYWQIRDLRDMESGLAVVKNIFYLDGVTFQYQTDFVLESLISVTLDGNELASYRYTLNLELSAIILSYSTDYRKKGSILEITYRTKDPVFSYTQGIREESIHGPYSMASGFYTTASGSYSEVHGYRSVASGYASEAHGFFTKAFSPYQTAFGKYNVPDSADKYAFIIGNGMSDSERVSISFNTTPDTTSFSLQYSVDYLRTYSATADTAGLNRGYIAIEDTLLADEYGFEIVQGPSSYYVHFSQPLGYYLEITDNSRYSHARIPPDVTSYEVRFRPAYVHIYNEDLRQSFSVSGTTLLLVDKAAFFVKICPNLSISMIYDHATIENSNALALAWDGQAELVGSLMMGGCVANGETPHSAIRYNTENHKEEFWNGTAWAMPAIAQGTLEADTTGIDIELPAGSLCILFTREYNASTNAYRGHHAYLEYVPNEDLYGTTAIQQVNMAASTNSGVTITRPNTSLLNIKSYSATYNVDYRIVRVL